VTCSHNYSSKLISSVHFDCMALHVPRELVQEDHERNPTSGCPSPMRVSAFECEFHMVSKTGPDFDVGISTRRILLCDTSKCSKAASAAMPVEDAVTSRCTYMHCLRKCIVSHRIPLFHAISNPLRCSKRWDCLTHKVLPLQIRRYLHTNMTLKSNSTR
jgi:hypothetical protein